MEPERKEMSSHLMVACPTLALGFGEFTASASARRQSTASEALPPLWA
jgi:hypothetical protein